MCRPARSADTGSFHAAATGGIQRLRVYSDGAARGNPGPSGAGAILVEPSGQVVERIGKFLGVQTNNYAEYMGMLIGLKRARELGDLSENAEYAAAKERQDLVGARLAQLKQRLSGLRMVDLTKIPRDSVGLGSTVLVFDVGKNVEVEYNLVTSEEADVPAGKISTTSPIGRSLLGKKAGDVAEVRTPGGLKEFEILKLTTIYGSEAANDQE